MAFTLTILKSKNNKKLVNIDNFDFFNFEKLIRSRSICARCIGRAFGRTKSDHPNITLHNFETLPKVLKESAVSQDQCELCYGIVSKVLKKVPKIVHKIQEIEFSSFLVGTTFSSDNFNKADQLLIEFGFSPMLLKHEINREVGLIINNKLGIPTEFSNPDLHITFEIKGKRGIRYNLRPRSLFFFGRYRKLKRGIPQTKWPCNNCKGRKCVNCEFTGQQYRTSVEQIVCKPFLETFHAKSSKFHGAGREDIDALMLGRGRPFVLELKKPHKRSKDLSEPIQKVNESGMVEILEVVPTEKKTIKLFKSSSEFTRKKYRALVKFEGQFPSNYLSLFHEFPLNLQQRTPKRVSHRRADMIREKKIFNVEITAIDSNRFEVLIEAQGGTYIKEFISGDGGRTQPNLSSILGIRAHCLELDVLEVEEYLSISKNGGSSF